MFIEIQLAFLDIENISLMFCVLTVIGNVLHAKQLYCGCSHRSEDVL